MDTIASVNMLRSQFLQVCPEKEQMRRIMKPYTLNNSNITELDPKLREAYLLADGTDILDQLESPPISKNFMENYSLLGNNRSSKGKGNHRKRPSVYNMESQIVEKEISQTVNNETINAVKKDSMLQDSSFTVPNNLDINLRSSLLINESQNNSIRTLKNNFRVVDNDSDFSVDTTKVGKKSTSRFARLFTGKKDSSESILTTNNKKKAEAVTKKSHIQKPSIFDMNFDYDVNLDEEDDEDDDDDDDDVVDSDIHAKFFHINNSSKDINSSDQKQDLNSTNSNGNSANDNGTSSNGPVNISKRISHFPQNIMPRNTAADVKSTSSKNEKNLLSIHGKKDELTENNFSGGEVSIGMSVDTTKNDSTEEPIGINRDEISDIDSFINDNDLDSLAIGVSHSTLDRSSFLKEGPEYEIAHSHQNKRNSNITAGTDLTVSELGNADDLSSYGKSLLFSDYSGDDFSRPRGDSTTLDLDSQSNTIFPLEAANSFDDFKLFNAPDDSTLDSVFNKAALNISNLKRQPANDNKVMALLSRDNGSKSTSNRRSSITSINIARQQSNRNNDRGDSITTISRRKLLKHREQLPKKQRRNSLDINSKYESSQLSMTMSSTSSRRNSVTNNSLAIEKISDFKKPEHQTSQLSSLFKKKKQKVVNLSELLDYFSFVSGNKVPLYEALKLEIYIQASKKYKREPFIATVRKSATVFEVIGYILYLYSTTAKPKDTNEDGLTSEEVQDPNRFSLQIVDEDGDPFEDNFGKLQRTRLIQTISDNEVVLCKLSDDEKQSNDVDTPLPYDLDGEMIDNSPIDSTSSILTNNDSDNVINQLSYYKPIVGNTDNLENAKGSNILKIKVFLYPNTNPKFNFTDIKVYVTSNINDILVKYCKMKNMDPNEYMLKFTGKNLILDLNDTVLRLDGNNKVEIISKKDARDLNLVKMKPNIKKPVLPTIQSNDLTPLTLDNNNAYLKPDIPKEKVPIADSKKVNKFKKHSKYKLSIAKQNSDSSIMNGSGSFTGGSSFFKSRNSSKTSLHGSLPYFHANRSTSNIDDFNGDNDDNKYPDLFSGAYHKYRVWRRQQMSLINKHERTLALDGDYIYIVPPDRHMHWHENVKTKSLHISQVVLVKRSKKIPEYFKIYVKRGQDDLKRYYFEAVSGEECKEIVSRIQNLLGAYRMNHKK